MAVSYTRPIVAEWMWASTVYDAGVGGADVIMARAARAGVTDIYFMVKGTGGRLFYLNTAYPDMLCGFLDLHGKYVSDFSINYYQEARLGTGLEIFREEGEDGQYLFRSVRADGETNVEASIQTADL